MSDFNPGDKVTKGSTIAAGSLSTTHQFTGSVYITSSVTSLSASNTVSASTFWADGVKVTSGVSTSPGGSDTQVQYNNGSEFGGVASLTYADGTGHLTVIDDKKLYFGTNDDASIEYDENGTDELIISSSAGGMDILIPEAPGGDNISFHIKDDSNTYMSIYTVAGQQTVRFDHSLTMMDDKRINWGSAQPDAHMVYNSTTDKIVLSGSPSGIEITGTTYFNEGIQHADDQKVYFGSGNDSSIEYDEDGDNYLIISGSVAGLALSGGIIDIATDAVMKDDKKLYFGSGQDASIEYDEDNTNNLIISGSVGGLILSGGIVDIGTDAVIADDKKLYFGTNNDASIEYREASIDEFVISSSAGGMDILIPEAPGGDNVGLHIKDNSNTYMSFNTAAGQQTVQINYSLTLLDNIKLNIGSGQPDCTLERDADGTDMLILVPPAAGMTIGSGFHRVAVDVTVDKADSGDNTVAVQLTGVKIPNDSIITRIVAITKTLGNLNTALYNIQISATNGTAADSAVSSGTEILGAGATGTEDSNGDSATDIIMSNAGNSGVVNKVWFNNTVVKTTYDAYVYIANAGTGNGTTDPATGTLTVIIEYYGID